MTAPAAGGGDTRDGRTAVQREIDDSLSPERRAVHQANRRIHDPARSAAAPADDTGELREAIAEQAWGVLVAAERDRFNDWNIVAHAIARNILALPAVRDLTDGRRTDRARIAAVEAEIARWPQSVAYEASAIRRALGGER